MFSSDDTHTTTSSRPSSDLSDRLHLHARRRGGERAVVLQDVRVVCQLARRADVVAQHVLRRGNARHASAGGRRAGCRTRTRPSIPCTPSRNRRPAVCFGSRVSVTICCAGSAAAENSRTANPRAAGSERGRRMRAAFITRDSLSRLHSAGVATDGPGSRYGRTGGCGQRRVAYALPERSARRAGTCLTAPRGAGVPSGFAPTPPARRSVQNGRAIAPPAVRRGSGPRDRTCATPGGRMKPARSGGSRPKRRASASPEEVCAREFHAALSACRMEPVGLAGVPSPWDSAEGLLSGSRCMPQAGKAPCAKCVESARGPPGGPLRYVIA